MSEKYTKEFEIHYHEVNKFKEATPITLLNFLEDTAISHSEAVGLGVDKLLSDGMGWVLSRWQLKIHRYPRFGEKILLRTWASSFERIFATREYTIEDAQGEKLADASSQWLFLNIEKRRPVRIPAEFGEKYGLHPERTLSTELAPLQGPVPNDASKSFKVRRNDIDTNLHVNNTVYAAWLLEAVPEEVYENARLTWLEIEYKKETAYGGEIISNCDLRSSTENYSEYSHSILDSTTHNELSLAVTGWTKR